MTRILVVDDDITIAHMLVEFLTASGYQAAFEPDGLKALQHIDLRRPDLVILDLMLPVVTGVEVARRLRTAPDSRAIPILAITGVDKFNDLAEVLMVDRIVPKPFDLDTLGREIENLLNGDPRQPSDSSDWSVAQL